MRRLVVTSALIGAAFLLSGCAEFQNRGGLVDKVADRILFPADTKSHRVLRSYVMAASLVSLAQRGGLPTSDLPNLATRVNTTLMLTSEAYVCAYESHSGCVFFDEKMARLDSSILRLALLVLFDSESKTLFDEVQDKLVADIPVLGPLTKGGAKAIEALGSLSLSTAQLAEIFDSLLRVSSRPLRNVTRLLPLYRDAIEMDMVVVLDYLARQCQLGKGISRTTRYGLYRSGNAVGCTDVITAYRLYSDGNGDLNAWRTYLFEARPYLRHVSASADHFLSVSRLIWSSCNALLKKELIDTCRGDFKDSSVSPATTGSYLLFSKQVAKLEAKALTRANEAGRCLSRGFAYIPCPSDIELPTGEE
jgi:hypothetical protein